MDDVIPVSVEDGATGLNGFELLVGNLHARRMHVLIKMRLDFQSGFGGGVGIAVSKLSITVRVIVSLSCLAHRLQAIAHLVQQLACAFARPA